MLTAAGLSAAKEGNYSSLKFKEERHQAGQEQKVQMDKIQFLKMLAWEASIKPLIPKEY